MRHCNRSLLTLVLAGTLSLGAAPAQAVPDGRHHHGEEGPAALSLQDGAKWKTDATLRRGMENIRDLLEPKLQAIHHDRLKPAQYAALASRIEYEVADIVAGCKLDREADAMLHLVLAEINAGTEGLAGKDRALGRHGGAVKIYRALENYPAYFEHPGWRTISHEE